MIDILGTVHSLTNHHSIALNPSIFALFTETCSSGDRCAHEGVCERGRCVCEMCERPENTDSQVCTLPKHVYMYQPSCHGALKLDMSTSFTTFFL